MGHTYRGAAGGALLLVVGGGSCSFPGAGGGGRSFTARLRGLRLRVLVLLCQRKQVTEPAAGSDVISTCGDVTCDCVCVVGWGDVTSSYGLHHSSPGRAAEPEGSESG